MRAMVVMGLVLVLAGCGSRSTGDWLHQLEDSEVVKRRQAIRELGGRTGDAAQVVPALVKALRDENGYVRRDAAVTLGKFGSQAKEATPELLALLLDKERPVRTAAAASLKKIDPEVAAQAGVK
jgi:HEAT repeat protein